MQAQLLCNCWKSVSRKNGEIKEVSPKSIKIFREITFVSHKVNWFHEIFFNLWQNELSRLFTKNYVKTSLSWYHESVLVRSNVNFLFFSSTISNTVISHKLVIVLQCEVLKYPPLLFIIDFTKILHKIMTIFKSSHNSFYWHHEKFVNLITGGQKLSVALL